MRISNLRLERNVPFKYGKPQARIICDMEAGFTDVNQIWFSVDDEYSEWLSDDVYDSFLVTLLYPAMYYGENIEIRGNVSKKIFHNIQHYVQGLVLAFKSSFHKVIVNVDGFKDAKKSERLRVGTGFSGGVDSFSTLADNFFNTDDIDYKIDTLFFFHVGQYGNVNKPSTWERAKNRYSITRDFAKKLGIESVMLSTNMFDFYIPNWEFYAGVLCRISSVLVFQKCLKRYYISSADAYEGIYNIDVTSPNITLSDTSDSMIMPLLSPNGLEILCDGAQYKRTEKTENISNLPLVHKHLNVCVNSSDTHVEATNCSSCSKCLRTMMALDSADALEKFSSVFDLKKWRKVSFRYKCEQVYLYNKNSFAQDNVDFARSKGKHLPNLIVAYIVVFIYKLYALPRRILRKLRRIINGH